MSLKFTDKYTKSFISESELSAIKNQAIFADKEIKAGTGLGNDFLGWVNLPVDYDKEEFARIKAAAEKIRKSCDVLVVIGIGGSYLGARAAIEFLVSRNYNALKKEGCPAIYFAGNGLSSGSIAEILDICKDKDVCVNVISKSGTTTEPAIAFRIFRQFMEEKYGVEGARDRIYVTTDKAKGTLKNFADKSGYETFVIPDDVGGRFSVLTAVGLLPIACAGCDIDALMQGAAKAREEYLNSEFENNDCLRYAAIRNILNRKGFSTEIFVSYEGSLRLLSEWWRQLYGESEGKDHKGLYPSAAIFSTDLHSLGQFIQDGSRIVFETIVNIEKSKYDVVIPHDEANIDGLNFLENKQLQFVNQTALKATVLAHVDGGVPNMVIDLTDRSEDSLGRLVYFFEYACAVSGYMLGVNPFDQPGVEAYKKNMFALLGKPGYDDLRSELEARMN